MSEIAIALFELAAGLFSLALGVWLFAIWISFMKKEFFK